ncbi:helix-turn-helix transcriptional regulator [Salinivibrio sp. MA440]|uniref:helix-turn-helix transcriptional regulator n=1 Tax=Salinivibrio sp. MA440 TaxID=1909456 RepID=UPI001055DDF4|nr:LuxR C-terminal-related transcriptional regulator [Salinivibrio sp. MA440]
MAESDRAAVIYKYNNLYFVNSAVTGKVGDNVLAFKREHPHLAKHYAHQVRQILSNQSIIETLDYICGTEHAQAAIYRMQKRPIYLGGKTIGAVFEGVQLKKAELALYQALNIATSEHINDVSFTQAEAMALVALKSGYNARQVSDMLGATHKAVRSRIERVMAKLDVRNRDELLEAVRHPKAITAITTALITESFSVQIS